MSDTAEKTPTGVSIKLSLMMFFQYAIWGAWLPLLYPFLSGHRGFSNTEISAMFAVGAVGAIFAPFLAGQIADRYFATEKYLGISHVVGGVLVWQLAHLESFWSFLIFSLLYSLIYAPTLSLTNSLAFHHIKDRDRDFGRVRVWGTVGWIAVGITIGQWLLRQHTPANVEDSVKLAAQLAGMADAFKLSALIGIIMGVYCFFLPHTPPAKGEDRNAPLEALGEIKRNPLLMLFLLAVPVSCIHQFYFVHTAGFLGSFQSETATKINAVFGVGGGGLMTIGQMSEILVLMAIPLVAKSLSRKTLLATGLVAYSLRMFLFAYVDSVSATTNIPEVAILMAGIALHGFCFGCFIFVAFMIVDEQTTGDVRASAQSLFNVVIVGIGIIAGSYIAGWVADWASHTVLDANNQPLLDEAGKIIKQLNYTQLFSVPMWASVACLVILLVGYPAKRKTADA